MFVGKRSTPTEIVIAIKGAHMELLRTEPMGGSATQTQSHLRWTKPTVGAIRRNCDASWCNQSRRGGIGVVARNAEGHLVGGLN